MITFTLYKTLHYRCGFLALKTLSGFLSLHGLSHVIILWFFGDPWPFLKCHTQSASPKSKTSPCWTFAELFLLCHPQDKMIPIVWTCFFFFIYDWSSISSAALISCTIHTKICDCEVKLNHTEMSNIFDMNISYVVYLNQTNQNWDAKAGLNKVQKIYPC